MLLSKLAAALPKEVQIIGNSAVDVQSLCTDSRKVEPGALFFCIPGLKADAHDFAPQALASGAVALVVERALDLQAPQIVVGDAREAWARIAAQFYGNPGDQLRIIGITGTKGKTTTSFLVKQILDRAGKKTGLIGTTGSMIGDEQLPGTLTTPDPTDFQSLLRQMLDAGVEYVVMEVSAHAMALRKLEGMRFEIGAFTNFSQDHLDFFKDMDHYFEAKMWLFHPQRCNFALYNADDERIHKAMEHNSVPHGSYSIREKSDIYAKGIDIDQRGSNFSINFHKRYKLDIQLQLSGIFNVYNALAAASICDALGIEPKYIQEGLESIKSVPGRIEILDTETPYNVILDYAHSPGSLENVLQAVRQTTKGRMITVFGCGGDRDHEKRPIMGEISGRLSDYSILTSDNPRSEDPFQILKEVEEGIKLTNGSYVVIENRREAFRHALLYAKAGDVVVLAGKGHETYQEIKGVKHPFDEKIVVSELLREIHDQQK